MKKWVMLVAEGRDPLEATMESYPGCKVDWQIRMNHLFRHPKAKEALRVLTEQTLRARLTKIINDPKSENRELLAAAKQLSRLDTAPQPEPKPKKKKGFQQPPLEDKDLAARMRDLGEKAKVN